PGIIVRGLTEPMLGRTLPTVARESEPTPERLNEPGFRFGERRPLMLGDVRSAPVFRPEGARKLPMLGEVRTPPNDGEWRVRMLGGHGEPHSEGDCGCRERGETPPSMETQYAPRP